MSPRASIRADHGPVSVSLILGDRVIQSSPGTRKTRRQANVTCMHSDRICATFLDISSDGAKRKSRPTLAQRPPDFGDEPRTLRGHELELLDENENWIRRSKGWREETRILQPAPVESPAQECLHRISISAAAYLLWKRRQKTPRRSLK